VARASHERPAVLQDRARLPLGCWAGDENAWHEAAAMSSSGAGTTAESDSGRTSEYHYPEIRFRDARGIEQTFLSEIGAGSTVRRYAIGQKIGVLYDPEGKVLPVINSWAGLWGPNLVRTIAGPLFIFGALLICWAFGDKILGR